MSGGAEEITVHGSGSYPPPGTQAAKEGENEEDVLQTGHRFEELLNPEDTWVAIWGGVKQALAKQGHTAVNIRSVHRLDPNDKTSRWKRQQVVCKCFGITKTKKVEDVEKQRKSHSSKTNCPFKVTVSWPRTGPPVVTQVVLEHNERCNARTRQAVRESCVSTEVLQRECYDDVRQWTMAGLRKTDMFRLLNARYAPLKLGEEGRRKVRNMAAKMERELLAVDSFRTDWEAGDPGDVLEVDVGKEAENLKASDDMLRGAVRDKLLLNMQGIANREASRLCANLGPRLTPEMALAIFHGLTIQVDALIAGSGVVAAPVVGPGASQHAPAPGMMNALCPAPESLEGPGDSSHVPSQPCIPAPELTGVATAVPQIDIGDVSSHLHAQGANSRTSPAKRSKVVVSEP